jgi:prepilin-type N-terminal cleavage/methylation domain-containing protein
MMHHDSDAGDAGFTLIELIVSTLVLLVLSGTVTAALLQMTNAELTLWNRTQMHSGVRSATELLQQEVGQAGRIALPAPVTLTGNVVPGAATVGVSSVDGMFVGEQLTIGAGATEETVTVTALDVGGD